MCGGPPDRPTALTALSRAGNGTRTRDPNLGKVVLYQLSYSRVRRKCNGSVGFYLAQPDRPGGHPPARSGGEGDRTPDLVNAIHALSQLSYAPIIFSAPTAPSNRNTASYRGVLVVSSDFPSRRELLLPSVV